MHFAHESEEKLSTMYNYTAIQTELPEPKLFATIKTDKQLVEEAPFDMIPVCHKKTQY